MDVSSSDAAAEPETEETFAMLKHNRRKRTIITPEQLMKLEELYKQEQWPGRDKKEELAREIEMSTHFVNIWFQNKRSRVKKLVQEEEEMKAMKSRVHVEQDSSQCDKKVLLAPKPDLRSNLFSPNVNNATVATRLPPPVISAPIQSVMPSLGGLPVFTISTKNVSSPALSVLTSLPQLTVPLIPQNTIFATFPQSACLQNKDKVNASPSTTLQTATSLGKADSVRPSTTNLRSPHPPKRFKSTTLTTLSSIPSSSSMNDTIPPNVCQQLTQHPRSPNSAPVRAPDSPSKLRTLTSSQDTVNNVPAPTLLRCMVLMMALSELPCSIPNDSSEFDHAVCAMLYGVKLNNGRVLTYNKQDGFHIEKVVRKGKKGKKKKKRKAGKKK
eukprot:XP_011667605.1 PREDICTED: homeobox protein 10-like [Strongylocentrotus purpuratus]